MAIVIFGYTLNFMVLEILFWVGWIVQAMWWVAQAMWSGLRRLCGGWVAYYSENNATSWPNLQAELFSFSAELKL